jgi:hypothetical protein
MILTNAIAQSAPIGGINFYTPGSVSANIPSDTQAPVGFTAGSNGVNWVGLPGPSHAINAMGVLAATGNLDWSLYSYFSFTTTSGTNLTLTFGLTAATTTSSWVIGQVIRVRITGAGTPSITWPATITWIGKLTGSGSCTTSAPVVTSGKQIDVEIVCTGPNTFNGRHVSV